MDQVGNGEETKTKEQPVNDRCSVEGAADSREIQTQVLASNSETATNGGKTAEEPLSTEEDSGKDITDATDETQTQIGVPASNLERATDDENKAGERPSNEEGSRKDIIDANRDPGKSYFSS